MFRFMAFLLLLMPLDASHLIPPPRKITPHEGKLLIDVRTAVIAPAALAGHAEVLAQALQKTTGFLHRTRTPREVGTMVIERAIRLALSDQADEQKPGFYRLEITPEGVTLTAADRVGLMHGAQTFVNLLPPQQQALQRTFIPAQTIEDWAENKRRIFHLDLGAHLYPTEKLKLLIDWLSFHKINELHLQFNSDHGWRMESTTFPRLHEVGSVRSSTPPYGDRTGSDSTEYRGYYTQEMLRELVAHAHARGLVIVPGFALTENASAILAAYPDLGEEKVEVANTWEPRSVGLRQDDDTLAFLDELFGEVAQIFPASEIRIEGPRSNFHPKLEKILTKHGRQLLVPTAFATTDFSLYPRPAEAELIASLKREAEGGFNPVSRVYQLPPSSAGMQATLRTAFVHDFEKLEYLVFPRLAAFAEAAWLPEKDRRDDDFRERLDHFQSRYQLAGLNASEPYHPPVARTKYGTRVSTTIEARPGHPPALVFDGRPQTFFWSAAGLQAGDLLTLEFPWPFSGEIRMTTGENENDRTMLDAGVLELSQDGKSWHSSAPFVLGKAVATAETPLRYARLRVTSPQSTPLILAEVELARPLLAPRHEESREIRISRTSPPVTLTFRADFREHPGLREEIEEARRFFFTQWLSLAEEIGVSTFPGTPRTFEIDPGEPGELSSKEVEAWMKKRMIPWLQNYPVSAPFWFTSGFTSYLLEGPPKQADRTKALAGGPDSAAFLAWVAQEHGRPVLNALSQDCRASRDPARTWKTLTRQSLEELVRSYQAEGR